MTEVINYIPSRIKNAAVGGHVAGAEDIDFDKNPSSGTSGEYPYNGLGVKYLEKNIVNGVNLLTQEMFSNQNTCYVIQYDFYVGNITNYDVTIDGSKSVTYGTDPDVEPKVYYYTEVTVPAGKTLVLLDRANCILLNDSQGIMSAVTYIANVATTLCIASKQIDTYQDAYSIRDNITIPANCTLEFVGGSINDGTLRLNNTKFEGDVNISCIVTGTLVNNEVYTKWFKTNVFENITNLLYSGKSFIFEVKEYDCDFGLRMLDLESVTFDFNGATVKDYISTFEPHGSSFHSAMLRGSSFIYVKNSNNITIKNLNYLGRISNAVYDWSGGVISIGRSGDDSIAGSCKNITLENITISGRPNANTNMEAIGCLGDVSNVRIEDITISNGDFTCGINFEYGKADEDVYGTNGKHPMNIFINNIKGVSLPNMFEALIRNGGSTNIKVNNVRAYDVLVVFNLFSGDEGINLAEGCCTIDNVSIKYTSASANWTRYSGSNKPSCINILNVGNYNGTTSTKLLKSWVKVNYLYTFNNIEITRDVVISDLAEIRVLNSRRLICFNNFRCYNAYIVCIVEGLVYKYTSETVLSDEIEPCYGAKFVNCIFNVQRAFYVRPSVKQIILENCRGTIDTCFGEQFGNYKTEFILKDCYFDGTFAWGFFLNRREGVVPIYLSLENSYVGTLNTNIINSTTLKKAINSVSNEGKLIKSITLAAKTIDDPTNPGTDISVYTLDVSKSKVFYFGAAGVKNIVGIENGDFLDIGECITVFYISSNNYGIGIIHMSPYATGLSGNGIEKISCPHYTDYHMFAGGCIRIVKTGVANCPYIVVEENGIFLNPGFSYPDYSGNPGSMHFTNGSYKYWNGSKFIEYDKASSNVVRYGNLTSIPTGDQIYQGFKYFVTDVKSPEGNVNGIEIICKSITVDTTDPDNPVYTVVWVDALGREITGLNYASKYRGSFDNKPTLTAEDAGFEYLDETNNRIIIWNGTAWCDATGTPLE